MGCSASETGTRRFAAAWPFLTRRSRGARTAAGRSRAPGCVAPAGYTFGRVFDFTADGGPHHVTASRVLGFASAPADADPFYRNRRIGMARGRRLRRKRLNRTTAISPACRSRAVDSGTGA